MKQRTNGTSPITRQTSFQGCDEILDQLLNQEAHPFDLDDDEIYARDQTDYRDHEQ